MPSIITTGKPAIVAATLLAACLTAAGTPMPALAAQPVPCEPFTETVCDTTVPSYDLSDGIGVDREPFLLDLSHGVDVDAIEWSDGWRTWDDWFDNTAHYPTRDGVSLTIPDLGEWEGGTVSARITVTDRNAGVIGTNPETGAVNVLTYTTGIADDEGLERPDPGLRRGLGLQVTLLVDGMPPDDSFRTLTGFTDLDGDLVDHEWSTAGEGWEMLDGVQGVWLPESAHLTRYGENGWAGTVDENVNGSTDTAHARRHYFAALTRGSFRVRYSAPAGDVDFISTFSPDDMYNIKAYPLEYKLNGGTGTTPNQQEGPQQ